MGVNQKRAIPIRGDADPVRHAIQVARQVGRQRDMCLELSGTQRHRQCDEHCTYNNQNAKSHFVPPIRFFLIASEFTLHWILVNRQEMTWREMPFLALSCLWNFYKSIALSFRNAFD
jgi:hypothetical protein